MKAFLDRICLAALLVLFMAHRANAQAVPDPAFTQTPPITIGEQQKALSGPTIVNYSGKDVPVSDVIEALFGAAGLPPMSARQKYSLGASNAQKRVSVDWQEVPFWTAAREFETLTGLTWNMMAERGLKLAPGSSDFPGWSKGRVLNDTPLVQVAWTGTISSSSTITSLAPADQGRAQTSGSASVYLAVYNDPKLRIESGEVRPVDIHLGDAAATLTEWHEVESFFHNPIQLISRFGINLPENLKSGDAVPALHGIIRSTVMETSQEWKIADVVKASHEKQVVGPVEYFVESAEIVAQSLVLRLSAIEPVEENAEKNSSISTILKLRDANGQPVERGATRFSIVALENGRRRVEAQTSFNLSPDSRTVAPGPYSLEWSIPATMRTLDTPFEIRDLKVP